MGCGGGMSPWGHAVTDHEVERFLCSDCGCVQGEKLRLGLHIAGARSLSTGRSTPQTWQHGVGAIQVIIDTTTDYPCGFIHRDA
jgi:hypothetical protein